MILNLLLLSLATTGLCDLASLRRFVEGGPAPVSSRKAGSFSSQQYHADTNPVIRVVPSTVESAPPAAFNPGVPGGARQVGGARLVAPSPSLFFATKPKQVARQKIPPVDISEILYKLAPTVTARPTRPPYVQQIVRGDVAQEANLGLVRLPKLQSYEAPIVDAVQTTTTQANDYGDYDDYDQQPHQDRPSVEEPAHSESDLRGQYEDELEAAVRLLRGNWDFVQKGGKLVITDDQDPLTISRRTSV